LNEPQRRKGHEFVSADYADYADYADEDFFAARLSAAEGGNIQINLRLSASICG
jgi:hypothetical protein